MIMKNTKVIFKEYGENMVGNVAGIWTSLCYLAMTDGNKNEYFIKHSASSSLYFISI